MKYTQIPTDTFEQIQLNAGIIVKSFTPETGTIGDILGATTGGITFNATPTFKDYGEDIDNCPKNTKELKRIDKWEATLAGTLATTTASSIKSLVAAGDIDSKDSTHIVPREALEDADFEDIWWVGDYSNLNGATNGGYCAVHLMNALSTAGFQIKTGDKTKGQFPFTYTAHYSIEDQEEIPFEIYIKAGSAEPTTQAS